MVKWSWSILFVQDRVHTHTPSFGYLHVSVQNMPLKILKEYQRSSMSQVCRRRIFAQSYGLHTAHVDGQIVLEQETESQRDHVETTTRTWYAFTSLKIQWWDCATTKNLTWVAIPRLRAPFCAWKNRRSPSWTSDLALAFNELIKALVFESKVCRVSKERYEYMDHNFKMFFAVIRCEPDTDQMNRN